MERRLAAILAADVVGYSRMIRADEEGTLVAVRTVREQLIQPSIEAHHGRIVKLMGDGILAEFASAVDAVRCAARVQEAMAGHNADRPEAQRVVFRIGVNLGDVVIDGTDIHGDGVNLASRLETLSEPGALCISAAVHEQVRDRLDLQFDDLGEKTVKNIDRPVRVWSWSPARTSPAPGPAAAGAPHTPDDKPSIAVLPFNNMSGDAEQEYFADGITEDIITDLSKVSGLLVIARNSSFAYKGQSPDIRKVCRDLAVKFVLEGSVRKAGTRVRINAQLIDGATGGHLWAERYDGDMEDIFAVQDEVTQEIVEALKITLTPDEEMRREGRRKIDPEAYDCLVRARACIYRYSAEGMVEGQALLERAIVIDPDFAGAYALLSVHKSSEYVNGWNGAGPENLDLAFKLANKALATDANEPMSYHALALAHMWSNDLEDAERAAEKAIELDPNFAGAFTVLGAIRDYSGNPHGAVEALQQALRLDPRYDLALQFLGRALFFLRRYGEAEEMFRKRLVMTPQSDMTRVFLAATCGHTDRPDEARRLWREVLELNPDFSVARLRQVLPYADPAWFDHLEDGLRKAGLPD